MISKVRYEINGWREKKKEKSVMKLTTYSGGLQVDTQGSCTNLLVVGKSPSLHMLH